MIIVSFVKKANNVKTKTEAYEYISRELMSDETHAISDMCGGLSKKAARGRYGNRTSYWDDPLAVPREAFAHMFDLEVRIRDEILYRRYSSETRCAATAYEIPRWRIPRRV